MPNDTMGCSDELSESSSDTSISGVSVSLVLTLGEAKGFLRCVVKFRQLNCRSTVGRTENGLKTVFRPLL